MDRPGFSRMDMIMGSSPDTELNHRWYRDDKKRKAFKRGGPEKPKVQPKYEKDLLDKFNTESQARFTKARENDGFGFSLPKIQTDLMKEYDKYDKRIILEELCPGIGYKPRGTPEEDKNRPKPRRIGLCEKYHRKKVGGKTNQKAKPKFKSYAEARKDREKFRKKLVELIMHRYKSSNSHTHVQMVECITNNWLNSSLDNISFGDDIITDHLEV